MIIGNGGAELGVRGYVSAYDAETGKLVWRFYTVPGNPADGPTARLATRSAPELARHDLVRQDGGSWAAAARSGIRWSTIPELDQLLIGVGNGSPWNHQCALAPGQGDNLFLASIVALDPDTGKYKWHYQLNPGETLGLHRHPADHAGRPHDRRPGRARC